MLLMVEASLHITVEMSFSGILSFSSSDTWNSTSDRRNDRSVVAKSG